MTATTDNHELRALVQELAMFGLGNTTGLVRVEATNRIAARMSALLTRTEAGAECEVCRGAGTIDETLGGYAFSNPKATCPDCDGLGEYARTEADEAATVGAEEWREVAGTGGAYSVSDRQRVRNNRTGKYLSTRSRAGAGYVKCDLHVNGDTRQTTLHRVVAEAFVDNPHGYTEVNHLDGDKTNNLPSNLEWCDRSRQTKHSFYELGQVVHKVQATPVSGEGPVLTFPSIEMAARHGFKSAHIYSCLNGVNKSHGGHYWESLPHPQDASAGDAVPTQGETDCPPHDIEVNVLSKDYEAGFKAGMEFEASHRLLPELTQVGDGVATLREALRKIYEWEPYDAMSYGARRIAAQALNDYDAALQQTAGGGRE